MAHESFRGKKVLHPKGRFPRVQAQVLAPMPRARATGPLEIKGERMAPPKVIGPDESLSDHLRHMASESVLREGHNTIRKVKAGHRLVSSSGRNLGTYRSRAGAEKRERQVQFFKNLKKSSGGPGSLRAKVRKRSLLK